MSKKIRKYVKVTHYCTGCKKAIKIDRNIVSVSEDFKISEIQKQLTIAPFVKCKKHQTYTEVSFSFYHEQKIVTNGS